MNIKLISSLTLAMSMCGGIAFADGMPSITLPAPPQQIQLPYHPSMGAQERPPLPPYMMEEPGQAWHMKDAMMGLGPAIPFMPSMSQNHFYTTFAKANVTHDGHLTKSQAEDAPELGFVVKNFDAIAPKGKNYVTFGDILAWQLDQQAQNIENMSDQMHKQAEILRSEN